jgi:hypothetical protein
MWYFPFKHDPILDVLFDKISSEWFLGIDDLFLCEVIVDICEFLTYIIHVVLSTNDLMLLFFKASSFNLMHKLIIWAMYPFRLLYTDVPVLICWSSDTSSEINVSKLLSFKMASFRGEF